MLHVYLHLSRENIDCSYQTKNDCIINNKRDVTSVKYMEVFHGVCYKYNYFRHLSIHCIAASSTDSVTQGPIHSWVRKWWGGSHSHKCQNFALLQED